MEKQFIFWIILLQITARIFVIDGGDANLENSGSGSGNSSSCIQLNTTQTNCSDNERQPRYYYINETNTCTKVYTCNDSSQDGHTSFDECMSSCGIERQCPPCPPLTPVDNAHLVYSNCKTSSRCHAYYRCEKGYTRFDNGNERRCVCGKWTSKPFCAKIALYYKGKQLEGKVPVVNLKNFTEETIECQLQPKLPANTNITWSPSDHNVRISWNNVRRSLELTVLSTKGQPSYVKTYKCSVTTQANGIKNKLELTAEVKVNVTYDGVIFEDPKIIESNVVYESNIVNGDCACSGFPKPIVTWYIDDTKLEENDPSVVITDMTRNEQHLTLSILRVFNPHSGKYKCKCSNTMTTVEGSNHTITISGSRKRRTTTKTTDIQTNLCTILQDQSTVAVVGQVKRHLPSSYLLHVKIIKQLQLNRHQPTLHPILKIQSYDQTIPRNKPQLMVLKLQDSDSQYHLVAQVPYFKHLETILKKECRL